MQTRTSIREVTFRKPFKLAGLDGVQPPGTYTVTMEEVMLDSLTVTGWRQTAVTMAVHNSGFTEFAAINPRDLHEALAREGGILTNPEEPEASARSRRARNPMRRGGRSYPA